MKKYHKIQTIWKRDPNNNFKTLLDGVWAKPEFEYLSDGQWEFTEKVDGTNMRAWLENDKLMLGGRTDKAQIPAFLYNKMQLLLDSELQKHDDLKHAILYGEGFGAKIQKGGGNYISDGVDFCLFDILIGDVWLSREHVSKFGAMLGLSTAPIIGTGTILDAIEIVGAGFDSRWGNFCAEGIVARPTAELKNQYGERVITKIKCKDFN